MEDGEGTGVQEAKSEAADDDEYEQGASIRQNREVTSSLHVISVTSSSPRHHRQVITITSPSPRDRCHVITVKSSPSCHHHYVTITTSPSPRHRCHDIHHHIITAT